MYSLRKATRTRRTRRAVALETSRKVEAANRAVLGLAARRGDEILRVPELRPSVAPAPLTTAPIDPLPR